MTAETSRLARRIVVGVFVGAAIVVAAVVMAVISLDRSLDRVDVQGLGDDPDGGPGAGDRGGGETGDGGDDPGGAGGADADGGVTAEALTLLILGSDSRDVLTSEERRTLGTGYAAGERTESIALLRLDPAADTIRMLNVPRDTLLSRCDGSRGRVNAAYMIGGREGVGGISCVVETLTSWASVTVDHAVKVDFRGFVDIVEAVGGVPIALAEPMVDERANLDLPAGCTRLDGAQALAFVRARSIDSDLGRIERQQRFVEELRTEVAELGVLSDPGRAYRTASALARAVELDSSLTLRRIDQLARQHRRTLRSPVEGRSLPGRTDRIDGIAFFRVASEDVEEAVDWLLGGEDPARLGHDAALGEPEDDATAGTKRPDPDGEGGEDDGPRC